MNWDILIHGCPVYKAYNSFDSLRSDCNIPVIMKVKLIINMLLIMWHNAHAFLPRQNGRFAYTIFRCIFVNLLLLQVVVSLSLSLSVSLSLSLSLSSLSLLSLLLKFHWNVLPRVKKNPNIGLDNGLAPNRHQSAICTNADAYMWHYGEMS